MTNQNTKLYSVIAYITWIGFLAAFFLHDRNDRMVRHHLNQALVLNIVETVGGIIGRLGGPFGTIGGIIDLAVLILFIMGIVRAVNLSDEPLPLIGGIRLL